MPKPAKALSRPSPIPEENCSDSPNLSNKEEFPRPDGSGKREEVRELGGGKLKSPKRDPMLVEACSDFTPRPRSRKLPSADTALVVEVAIGRVVLSTEVEAVPRVKLVPNVETVTGVGVGPNGTTLALMAEKEDNGGGSEG